MTKVAASSHEHPDFVTVAVDTGGTFTDLVARVDGALARIKTPSTPDDPAEAVVTALRSLWRDLAEMVSLKKLPGALRVRL